MINGPIIEIGNSVAISSAPVFARIAPRSSISFLIITLITSFLLAEYA
jgi:hypothetical protein